MISLRGVSLVYPNGVRALDNVSLEIAKGEFVFLVGDSGTGKSSLLRLLYREVRTTHAERSWSTESASTVCGAIASRPYGAISGSSFKISSCS